MSHEDKRLMAENGLGHFIIKSKWFGCFHAVNISIIKTRVTATLKVILKTQRICYLIL